MMLPNSGIQEPSSCPCVEGQKRLTPIGRADEGVPHQWGKARHPHITARAATSYRALRKAKHQAESTAKGAEAKSWSNYRDKDLGKDSEARHSHIGMTRWWLGRIKWTRNGAFYHTDKGDG
jgi:hypothetical protein